MFSAFFQLRLSLNIAAKTKRKLRQFVSEIEGWISPAVAELLYDLSWTCQKRGSIVEIGSWQGKSTLCLAQALCDSHSTRLVHAVDPHTGSHEHQGPKAINTLQLFLNNLDRFQLQNNIKAHICSSREANQQIESPIAMVWIDGSHEYDDVTYDFENWFDRLIPGGYVAFHDSNWPGVRRVLWEQVYPHPLAGVVLKIEQTTFVRKLRRPSVIFTNINRLSLFKEQKLQALKRFRRRRSKRRKALSKEYRAELTSRAK